MSVGFDTYIRRRLRIPTVAATVRVRCGCKVANKINREADLLGVDVPQAGHEKHALVCPRGPTSRTPTTAR